MKIIADTNVLVRFIMRDDEKQAAAAARVLTGADLVAISLPALCEVVWVLLRGYKMVPRDIGKALRVLIGSSNVIVNYPAAEAGLSFFDAGGDFADGVIAYEGNWLGADTFVSFDKKAVGILREAGRRAVLLR